MSVSDRIYYTIEKPIESRNSIVSVPVHIAQSSKYTFFNPENI